MILHYLFFLNFNEKILYYNNMKDFYKIVLYENDNESKIIEEDFPSLKKAERALNEFRDKNKDIADKLYNRISIIKIHFQTIKNIELNDTARTDKKSRKKKRSIKKES